MEIVNFLINDVVYHNIATSAQMYTRKGAHGRKVRHPKFKKYHEIRFILLHAYRTTYDPIHTTVCLLDWEREGEIIIRNCTPLTLSV